MCLSSFDLSSCRVVESSQSKAILPSYSPSSRNRPNVVRPRLRLRLRESSGVPRSDIPLTSKLMHANFVPWNGFRGPRLPDIIPSKAKPADLLLHGLAVTYNPLAKDNIASIKPPRDPLLPPPAASAHRDSRNERLSISVARQPRPEGPTPILALAKFKASGKGADWWVPLDPCGAQVCAPRVRSNVTCF